MIVYISGSVTNTNDYKQRFETAKIMIEQTTHDIPICPITLCNYIPEGSEWIVYMKACIKALCDCDKIYMLKGWENSRGARVEHGMAKLLGLIVEYE